MGVGSTHYRSLHSILWPPAPHSDTTGRPPTSSGIRSRSGLRSEPRAWQTRDPGASLEGKRRRTVTPVSGTNAGPSAFLRSCGSNARRKYASKRSESLRQHSTLADTRSSKSLLTWTLLAMCAKSSRRISKTFSWSSYRAFCALSFVETFMRPRWSLSRVLRTTLTER